MNNTEGIDKPQQIYDELGNLINPATSDKQDQIITALNTLVAGQGQVSAINQGTKSIAVTNTAVQLGSDTTIKRVIISTPFSNSDVIVFGGSGVIFTEASRTGAVLSQGASVDIPIDNLNKVYINGTAGDKVSFTYYT